MKQFVIVFLVACTLAIGFVVYSVAVSFSNWPWTRTRVVEGEDALGFALGSTKRSVIELAIELKVEGAIEAVRPMGLPPYRSGDRFIGERLEEEDLSPLMGAARWHVGIAGDNAWLLLHFADDTLVRVERVDYSGPTI